MTVNWKGFDYQTRANMKENSSHLNLCDKNHHGEFTLHRADSEARICCVCSGSPVTFLVQKFTDFLLNTRLCFSCAGRGEVRNCSAIAPVPQDEHEEVKPLPNCQPSKSSASVGLVCPDFYIVNKRRLPHLTSSSSFGFTSNSLPKCHPSSSITRTQSNSFLHSYKFKIPLQTPSKRLKKSLDSNLQDLPTVDPAELDDDDQTLVGSRNSIASELKCLESCTSLSDFNKLIPSDIDFENLRNEIIHEDETCDISALVRPRKSGLRSQTALGMNTQETQSGGNVLNKPQVDLFTLTESKENLCRARGLTTAEARKKAMTENNRPYSRFSIKCPIRPGELLIGWVNARIYVSVWWTNRN